MEKFTVTTKHTKPPKNKNNFRGISGLEEIYNPFKLVNISRYNDIRDIDSIESHKYGKKGEINLLALTTNYPTMDPMIHLQTRNTPDDRRCQSEV